jgi:hypothetical protein
VISDVITSDGCFGVGRRASMLFGAHVAKVVLGKMIDDASPDLVLCLDMMAPIRPSKYSPN